MNRNYVEKLPQYFQGEGNYYYREYLTLKRKGVIGLFSVHDEYDQFHYEVAVINFKISYETENRVEQYPTDNKLNYLLWKFLDEKSAEKFYNWLIR
jgi:hypothetical protein